MSDDQRQPDEKPTDETARNQTAAYLPLGISLGLSLGIVFGLLIFDNIALGISLGLAIGAGLGVALAANARNQSGRGDGDEGTT